MTRKKSAKPIRKLCAIFPLLPDPSDFIRRCRELFPVAQITLYTANAEAAERAAGNELAEIVFVPIIQVSPLAPSHLRRFHFDAVVIAAESDQLPHYLMHLIQAFTWFGAKRFVMLDGRIQPMRLFLPRLFALSSSCLLPPVLLSVLLHLFWLTGFVPALLLGFKNRRKSEDIHRLILHTKAMLTSPLAYLANNPSQYKNIFIAAFRVLFDYARGTSELQSAQKKQLLLIRLDHIGDLILNTTILETLAKNDAWEITLVAGPWTRAVVQGDPRLAHLLIYPSSDLFVKRQRLAADARRQRREVRKWLTEQHFDVVLEPGVGPDALALAYLPRTQKRVIMHTNRWFAHGLCELVENPAKASETERLARLLTAAGIHESIAAPKLFVTEQLEQAAAQWLIDHGITGPFLAIHPGAAWAGRMWPSERFAALARLTYEKYKLIPVAFLAPDETNLRDSLLTVAADLPFKAAFGLPLDLVFALLAKATAFVGNDSGLMHAASALGLPTLGIFGPGDLTRWRPAGEKTVVATLRLACSPCYQSFCTDPRCIKELSVELVWRKMQKLLGD